MKDFREITALLVCIIVFAVGLNTVWTGIGNLPVWALKVGLDIYVTLTIVYFAKTFLTVIESGR